MNVEQFDLIWAALHKWLEATTHEERTNILLQHPELLGPKTEEMFDLLIYQARNQGEDEAVEFLNHRRDSLKVFSTLLQEAFRQIQAKTADQSANDEPK
jgi:hypothetical protein